MPIWTFGAARPTRHSSTTSIALVVFTTRYGRPFIITLCCSSLQIYDLCFFDIIQIQISAGVTRPFIRSPRRSSRARTESSFSGRSDTSILHTHIVPQKSDYGSKVAVVVTLHAALVIFFLPDPVVVPGQLMCPFYYLFLFL